jgi:YrbI family 3-deoxy-D-manno-octulosonate 8-phosphate phosphatase
MKINCRHFVSILVGKSRKGNMLNEELKTRLRKIKLVVMDVDGTLTDAKVYYSRNGEELKSFSIRDGMGIDLLRLNGIAPAIMTSEDSQIVTARAKKLKIEHVILGAHRKDVHLRELSEKTGIPLSDIAFLGDDINDLPAMEIAGLSICPADAHELVKSNVNYICSRNGGNGAAREMAELILTVQNKPITLPGNW